MSRERVQELITAEAISEGMRAFDVHTVGGLTVRVSDIESIPVEQENGDLNPEGYVGRLQAHAVHRLGFKHGVDATVLLPPKIAVDGVFDALPVGDPESYNDRTHRALHAYLAGDWPRISRIDALYGRSGQLADPVARHRLEGAVAIAATGIMVGGTVLYRKVIRH